MSRILLDTTGRVISLGRDEIRTAASELTIDNLATEMTDAHSAHLSNRVEIEWLLRYFKGYQPYVLEREKLIREEIDNRIVINYASSATRDIVGFLLGKPIQYVPRDTDKSKPIQTLNEYLDFEDKVVGDFELAQFASICGTSYRGVFADPVDDGTPPFDLVTLDPRNTYCVYSSDPTKRDPLFAVSYYTEQDAGSNATRTVFTVYTDRERFEFTVEGGATLDFTKGMSSVVVSPHILGRVPIVEYLNNQWRMGDWETALSLLDAINIAASDSLNDIVQVVNSLLALIGAELDKATLDSIRENKVINLFDIPAGVSADVKFISQSLDATSISALREYLEASMRVVVGIPDRKTRSGGGSDTGEAVNLRDGWMDLDLVVSNKENFIISAERKVIGIALGICQKRGDLTELTPMDIEIKFSRSKSSNLLTKAQSYSTLMSTKSIAPADALEMVDLTTDEQDVTKRGEEYWDEKSESQIALAQAGFASGTQLGGQSGDSTGRVTDDDRTDRPEPAA